MGGTSACNSLLSNDVVPVPSGPPRKVEVEAVNSTAVKVSWRSPVPNKQHGQIRGYQVHYVRMENGESKGQPMLKDIMLADAQVIGVFYILLWVTVKIFCVPESYPWLYFFFFLYFSHLVNISRIFHLYFNNFFFFSEYL